MGRNLSGWPEPGALDAPRQSEAAMRGGVFPRRDLHFFAKVRWGKRGRRGTLPRCENPVLGYSKLGSMLLARDNAADEDI